MRREDIKAMIDPADVQRISKPIAPAIRAHYNLCVELAHNAARNVKATVREGLPRMVETAQGGTDGMTILRQRRLLDLINNFAFANRALWNAASAVCEVEDLLDDGREQGIEWEVTL